MKYYGLTDQEVENSREKYGSNKIADSKPLTFWEAFKETFKDPMIKILLAIAVLMIGMYFFGYAEIYEPLGTIVAVLIVAFVTAKTGIASDLAVLINKFVHSLTCVTLPFDDAISVIFIV